MDKNLCRIANLGKAGTIIEIDLVPSFAGQGPEGDLAFIVKDRGIGRLIQLGSDICEGSAIIKIYIPSIAHTFFTTYISYLPSVIKRGGADQDTEVIEYRANSKTTSPG